MDSLVCRSCITISSPRISYSQKLSYFHRKKNCSFAANAKSKGFAELIRKNRKGLDAEKEDPADTESDDVCPCGGGESKESYESCCGVFHRGEIEEPDALTVMKARYSAYARGVSAYIAKTTHKENPALGAGEEKLIEDIKGTCQRLKFKRLEITDFETTSENEAFVSFKVVYSVAKGGRAKDNKLLEEKSRFVRDEDGKWKYIEGNPLSQASQAAWALSVS